MKLTRGTFCHLWVILTFIYSLETQGASVPQNLLLEKAEAWMGNHPIMAVMTDRSTDFVETFPDSNGYSVLIVQFLPSGYLVLNTDDRLPLVVSFSVDSIVNLTDSPQNTFHHMLLRHVEAMEQRLTLSPQALNVVSTRVLNNQELYGPYLETTWNQCNPYNKMCPDNPDGSEYYGYRAATGCVPTAFAQILRFHRWPVHGRGMHRYTDEVGHLTGEHTAVFLDDYDWDSMASTYDPWNESSWPTEEAVAELMYEFGVAAEADYDSAGTSAPMSTLTNHLNEYFYYEPPEYQSSRTALMAPMESDLRAGFPCVAAVTGHAIVADGLMIDGNTKTYHINYGWGGTNNGWWTAYSVPGGGLVEGMTSLRPQLLAFPLVSDVHASIDEDIELQWIVPKRREAEMAALSICRLEQQSGLWNSNLSPLEASINTGWETVDEGRSGDCWHTGPNGPVTMVLDEIFIPNTSTSLIFWTHYRLGTATFTVSVSTDDGLSYDELFADSEDSFYNWEKKTVSLSHYANQEIRLRFALSAGSFYSNGGVWLDDVTLNSGTWFDWQPFAADQTLASRRFSAKTTPWDDCDDFTAFEVTSTSSYQDWTIDSPSEASNCFYKPAGGYSNKTYHLTSRSPITPTASTRLHLHTKYVLASDRFRVLVAPNGQAYQEVWAGSGSLNWSDITIDLSAYADQDLWVRLEYEVGNYYEDGGIWIDSISTQEVVHPELEGQPVYYSVFENLPIGTHTLAAKVVDTEGVTHPLSPAFTLTINAP